MSTHAATRSTYMKVFIALAVLTAIEIAITFAPILDLVIAGALVVFSLWKASLVAMYFMHLKFERRHLSLFALAPLALSILLLIALLPDITSSTKAERVARTEAASVVAE